MTLSDPIKRPQRRINPHRGLVVDTSTWADAHDYHRAAQQLHSLFMHCPGVVAGLEVMAGADPPDGSVVIYPGVAVDEDGYTIVVGEPHRFHLRTEEEGTIFLLAQYREIPDESVRPLGFDEPQPRYTLEAYRLEERRDLPQEPYVELARVRVSGTGAPVANAGNLRSPEPDEIDLRQRPLSGPRPLGQVGFGLVSMDIGDVGDTGAAASGGGTARHLPGVMNLIQAINGATQYRAHFQGSFDLSREITGCGIMVMAGYEGFSMTEESERILGDFLERGGMLLGEACGADLARLEDAVAFRQSFGDLAGRLGRDLSPVDRGHPLLTALHFFTGVPEGVDGPGLVVAGDGIVYSDGDYGCLWNGGWTGKPASRESIRSGIELGTNLGVYSSQRARLHALKMDRPPED